jgi:hypothetical protein
MYLALEVGDPQFPARFPTHGTQDTAPVLTNYDYVALTLYGRPFQATSTSKSRRLDRLITPHLPCGIRFRLFRFHSPLITESRLISLPVPTKMFQSGTFPILNGSVRRLGFPIRTSSVQWLHAPRRGLSQLGTSFVST